MVGPAMAKANAQANQPRSQRRVGVIGTVAPRRSVIDEQPQGQSVATKTVGEVRLHGVALFVGTGLQAQVVAGMIIEHGQGMTATGGNGGIALEVHLPTGIWQTL